MTIPINGDGFLFYADSQTPASGIDEKEIKKEFR
jgi:hypothetical protein